VAQTPTTCSLQPSLSELLKRPLSKTLVPSCGRISATTHFLAVMQQYRWTGVLSVCQARWKSDASFLRYKQKTIFKKQTNIKVVYAFLLVKCIWRCVKWTNDYFGTVWKDIKLIHDPLLQRYAQKNDFFLHFRSQWAWPLVILKLLHHSLVLSSKIP